MVRFKHFKVRNANPFVKLDLDLDRQGLVRVVGPNGAGKSSLWHLLTFLIYGSNPNKSSKSNIQMDKKNFLLEASFEKLGVQYLVAEAVKTKEKNPNGEPYGNGYFLFRKESDGTWKDISWHQAKDTRKLVQNLLGWNLDEWYGYVYLAQQTTHILINGTPSERQKYLSALFSLDPLDKIAEHYKIKVESFAEKIREIEKQMSEFGILQKMLESFAPVDQMKEDLKNLEYDEEDLALLHEQNKTLQLQYLDKVAAQQAFDAYCANNPNIKNQNPESLQKELEELIQTDAEIKALDRQIQEINTALVSARNKLNALPQETLPEDYEQIMQSPDISLESERALLSELKAFRTRYPDLPVKPEPVPPDVNEILKYRDIDLEKTEWEIQKIRNHPKPPAFPKPEQDMIEDLRYEVSTLKSRIALLNEKKGQLEIEGNCPTCGSVLDSDHRAKHREQIAQELEDLNGQIEQASQILTEKLTEQKAWIDYEKHGPDRSAELPDLIRSCEQYEAKQKAQMAIQLNAEWEKIAEKFERSEQIPQIEKRIADYEKKLRYRELKEKLQEAQKLQEKVSELEETHQALVSRRSQFTDVGPRLTEIRALLQGINDFRRLHDKLNSFNSNLEDLTETLASTSETLTVLRQKISDLKGNIKRRLEIEKDLQDLSVKISEGDQILRNKTKCEILAKAYGKAGKIRQLQLAKFAKYLEDALTCHTFRQLPNHRLQIKVEDGIEILTSKNGSEPYDVKFMSGGEKGALSVAFMFALDDMQTADKKTAMKVIDEAEAAFDQDRKYDFIDYTLPELKRRAETIVIISHSQMSDESMFDRTWEVRDGTVQDKTKEVREFI